MNRDPDDTLNTVLRAIRNKWGADALRKLGGKRETLNRLPTGHLALDDALSGGLPIARITELCGTPTSGATTLALTIAAAVQAARGAVVWIDGAHALDADYAAHCTVDLDSLLLVRPRHGREALEIAGDIVTGKAADLVVIAPGLEEMVAPPGTWQKLAVKVAKSQVSMVMVSSEGDKSSTDASYVSLRLHVERTNWLWTHEALVGWGSQVTVVKNKLGPAGQAVTFDVHLPECTR